MKSQYDCMIHHQLLKKEYIKGPVLDLKLLGYHERDLTDGLPFYCFQILLAGAPVGKITLRIGFNETTLIHGHIGYGIDLTYRGHGYSYYALEMIKDLAREHGYKKLMLTTESNNEQSIRIVQKSGGRLIELEKRIPETHIYYVIGIHKINVYEISL
ncbi:MAG: GNAT family N-acetyltransferase [Acholeplasmataceae bacterium]|nr:GNAT family N-acetyltransferase [Acholeplasmataceae bacterium]